MSSARTDTLANIRRSLGVTGRESTRSTAVEERLERAPRGVVPARGKLPQEGREQLFKTMAEAAQATVEVVASSADVPRSVAEYLRRHNLPAAVRMGADARLKIMPWQDTTLDVAAGPSEGGDLAAVSHAFAGVAETGTLVLVSGPDNPTTLNFLPDSHIVVVKAKDIAGDYEDMWTKLRFAHGKAQMPRTVNWITGPSRSGDIEQTLLLGAHGPRSVHILVVKD